MCVASACVLWGHASCDGMRIARVCVLWGYADLEQWFDERTGAYLWFAIGVV